ncbi:Rho GTPase activation protein [Peniophora sp. CONT]|nr:Rho GTPase activation protein [Peniophora sp. CONT]
MHGKEISGPVPNDIATRNLTPVKKRAEGRPIMVERTADAAASIMSIRSGAHPILPENLSMDIRQFATSDFAKQYFATHRTGIIFKRTVPMSEMMAWQRQPLSSPLLNIPRQLHKDAVKIFRVIQRLMGDERGGRPVARMADPSAQGGGREASVLSLWEEERWLLQMGLSHGELRDEIYCQVTKQLISNPSPESVFKGWQLLCILVITFPPSKNFESYLQSFLKQRTTHTEGRVDVMAKHCLKRLCIIAKRGPRGKPPTVAELETASDAAFNPSTFGESLDAVYRLQERNYPRQKIPIILPFLADGILALGGTKSEGIFRVPGDGDLVSDLKLRIDKGYYTLEGVDDPHVLASLLKLWLRELRDPLVPEEMYNDCIAYASEPDACVGVVERLPTINRRVVLFVISFLQLFLDEKVVGVTKMTSANLALVMAPNLLRCNSESMAVVFTNASYEQTFVHNLLLHLDCETIDPDYVPKHGLGAVTSTTQTRTSKSRSRRPTHS